MDLIYYIILAIIEGITEFLPISSTGHLIIVSSILDMQKDPFLQTYNIFIQFGAIVSVMVKYYKRFLISFKLYFLLFMGVLPVVILGLTMGKEIESLLDYPQVVGVMLVVGGIILVLIDRWTKKQKEGKNIEDLKFMQAIKIGIFQCLAVIPGTSRAAASIFGGLFVKLKKKEAITFSFFLAVPTILGASIYKLFSYFQQSGSLDSQQINILIIGNVVAFVSAYLSIHFFISFINKFGFKWFGYYRIVVGSIVLFFFL